MQPADIVWREDGLPTSRLYGDVYFSLAGGLAETRHVFLHHNGLPERFERARHFTIAETGFGTGLNFLATWQAFVRHAPADAVLHYISVEKHPLRKQDLSRALDLWPELEEYAHALRHSYPAPVPGVHRLLLSSGRIRLTLFFGEALEWFDALDFRADAWFLDGFAPAANPAMWEETLLAALPSRSAARATFATFTAAGHVRRALESAGFNVEKVRGFGHKRDMLRGTLAKHAPGVTASPSASALIIGAGAAGAAAAYALALRGTEVTVIDRRSAPAQETSANDAAILFPFSSRAWMPQTRFYLAGLQYTRAQLSQLRAQGHAIAGELCGMVQCPKPSQEEAHLLEIPALLELDEGIVTRCGKEEASRLCGLTLPGGALYWPDSGWYSLHDYTLACLSHPRIRFLPDTEITALKRTGGMWVAYAGSKEAAHADSAILANAASSRALLPKIPLPLRTVRGQVTHLPVSEATQHLKTVLCFGGYLLPPQNGFHCLGATYERQRHDTVVHEDSHRANLELAAKTLPRLPREVSGLGGWAGIRTTTPDKLPLVGALSPDGLCATLGHGSRAALSAPLSGEILASLIHGEPLPVANPLASALRPLRF